MPSQFQQLESYFLYFNQKISRSVFYPKILPDAGITVIGTIK